MQIRLKDDFQQGHIQFLRGEMLDLPQSEAQQLIDDGKAVAVHRAEFATTRKAGR